MHRFAATVSLFALTACAACATSNPNEAGTTTERVTMSEGAAQVFELDISRGDAALTTRFDASPHAVWRLLPDVYAELGLPEPVMDASTRMAAVQDHAVMRRIGDERMSRLLDCGRDMAGYHADTHRIRLDVRTWVTDEATAADVHTRVTATATSVEGRAGVITCTTRRRLEQLISESLRTLLAAG